MDSSLRNMSKKERMKRNLNPSEALKIGPLSSCDHSVSAPAAAASSPPPSPVVASNMIPTLGLTS